MVHEVLTEIRSSKLKSSTTSKDRSSERHYRPRRESDSPETNRNSCRVVNYTDAASLKSATRPQYYDRTNPPKKKSRFNADGVKLPSTFDKKNYRKVENSNKFNDGNGINAVNDDELVMPALIYGIETAAKQVGPCLQELCVTYSMIK